MTLVCKPVTKLSAALACLTLSSCASVQPAVASSAETMNGTTASVAGSGAVNEVWVKKHVVVVRSYTQRPEFARPWRRQKPYARVSNALVIDGKQLLLTTNDTQTMSLVEVRRVGEQEWFRATLKHVDHDIPAAILRVDDPRFFDSLEATSLEAAVPARESDVELVEATGDNPEFGKGKIASMDAWRTERLSVPSLLGTTAMTDFGDSEPVLFEGKVVGLSQATRKGGFVAIPSALLKQYVEASNAPTYPGYGRAGIRTQDMTNPALKRMLGLKANEGGVRIISVDVGDSADGVLKVGDVLLSIEALALDGQGRVNHPRWGRVPFSTLFMDNKRAGDTVNLSVLRDGQRQAVALKLKRIPTAAELVPSNLLSLEPRYTVQGGLVFQALNQIYLSTQWSGAPAPILNAARLANAKSSKRQDIVVLTEVLPDAINLGYQDLRNLVVERINGQAITKLEDVAEALKTPSGSFHTFEFFMDEKRIVLDASQLAAANARIPLN
jgi:hypothetical protein